MPRQRLDELLINQKYLRKFFFVNEYNLIIFNIYRRLFLILSTSEINNIFHLKKNYLFFKKNLENSN